MRLTSMVTWTTLVTSLALVTAPSVQATRTGVACRILKNPISMATQRCICTPCHVCEYNVFKLGCQIIQAPDTDLSDGSEIKAVQPNLQATDWYLTDAEITKSRGGIPRSQLQVFTGGNKVEAFPSSDELFMSVYNDIERSAANDTVYLAGWGVDDVPFDPLNDPTGDKSSFRSIMSRAVKRGADVRALIWRNLLEGKQNIEMRDYINSLPAPTIAGPARFVFDDRMPELASSVHQKSLVLRQSEQLIAYVGGVDLTTDRWDTINHNQFLLRQQAKIKRDYDGWLDSHYRIEGPATLDVGANFLQRWNSNYKPVQGIVGDVLDKYQNPPYSALPPLDANGALDLKTDGRQMVQITRTFSCKYRHYEEYAPKGENSLLQARVKAIKMAKNYIYIEDQYFVLVPELLIALLEVLPRIQRLVVVAQRVEDNLKLTGYEKYFFDMVAPIQKRFPNKFQLYTTKKERNLYIHSKIVIIDDVYLSMGSANWNRRSMTSDVEIGANVVDTELVTTPDNIIVGKIVHDFRVRKFAEKIGRTYDEIVVLPLLDAADALDIAAQDPSSIIEVLEVQELPSFAVFTEGVREQVDPDDKCVD